MLSAIQTDNVKININTKKIFSSVKTDFKDAMDDTYKVEFHYYHKPENSQPITTKSMQEMYQTLEERAKKTYFRLHKHELEINPKIVTKQEQKSPLTALLQNEKQDETIDTATMKSVSKNTNEDIYKVNFKYYHKSKNSQPITTKSMQEMYQALEERAKNSFLRIEKAQQYSKSYALASQDEDTTKNTLYKMYLEHIYEMKNI